MAAYYNEIDPFAAAWLRQLILAGEIADGEVDERSIEDVRPSDLRGFIQCHFFAGIGGWSRALKQAGWRDDRRVWTGSCPCQSFSAAGQGKGFADERHLWPAWFHLISECLPPIVFGEQVDAAIKHGWLDLVQTDLEAAGYAVGHAVIPAAGVGAPHGRHRLWFVADAGGETCGRNSRTIFRTQTPSNSQRELYGGQFDGSRDGGAVSGMAITNVPDEHRGPPSGQQPIHEISDGQSGPMEHASLEQARISRFARERRKTAGFWADADWIPCRDEKWRPIEPGVFPLAHGVPGRMDKLRGFGNAIVPPASAAFIEAYMRIAA